MSAETTCTLTVQCRNRRCKQKSPVLEMRNQIVVCTECGTGQRVRIRRGAETLRREMLIMSLAPLEPEYDEHQAASCGALMAGWR